MISCCLRLHATHSYKLWLTSLHYCYFSIAPWVMTHEPQLHFASCSCKKENGLTGFMMFLIFCTKVLSCFLFYFHLWFMNCFDFVPLYLLFWNVVLSWFTDLWLRKSSFTFHWMKWSNEFWIVVYFI